jgi:diguanylate cyclase (GGDEF)-like protein
MDVFAIIKKYLYVLDLPENDKAVIVNILISALYFSYYCVARFSENLPAQFQITNLEYVYLTEQLSLVSILCLNILLLYILYLRRTNPGSMLPNNIQVYLIGQPLALYAILNGVTQLITGLLLGMLPFVGIILFNRKHVFYATCMMWIEIVALAFCVSAGVLPNAPLFVDSVKAAQVPLAFSLVQMALSLPVAVVMYAMGHALMQGLVLKEKKILELSRTDVLTGLWNRRYLNELLEHEIALTHRGLNCLSVILLDLDFFKQINDTYGHSAGDKVLIATTHVLRQNARETDYVGRFGGEEFLIVLSNCDVQSAVDVANRYRTMLEEHPIKIGDEVIHVTGSFGLTTLLPTDTPHYDKQVCLDQLINSADKALYDAKHQGRNCVKFRAFTEV